MIATTKQRQRSDPACSSGSASLLRRPVLASHHRSRQLYAPAPVSHSAHDTPTAQKQRKRARLLSLRVTRLRGVLRVPVDPNKQPSMRQEPQPLVPRRQRNRLAYPAERHLARCAADREPVAWPLADHGFEPPGAVRVAVRSDPGYAAVDPGFHAIGQPGDEE